MSAATSTTCSILGTIGIAILIGDVAGKGIDAARLTTLMRDGARAYLMEGLEPAEAVSRLNALAHRFTPVDKFATLFLGVLDRATGEFRHRTAGHPLPVAAGSRSSGAAGFGGRAGGRLRRCGVRVLGRQAGERRSDVPLYGRHRGGTGDGGMYGVKGIVSFLEHVRGLPAAELPSALLEDVRSSRAAISVTMRSCSA